MSEGYDRIVVAVDFSETSEEAWAAACRLAVRTNSQVHLLHVSPDPLQQAWSVEAAGIDVSALRAEWRKQAEERLASIRPVSGLDDDRIVRVVLTGVPHVTIAEYAAEQDADLIVVGTHGYGPIKHFLLGSVAERVVRQAPCPVMTVSRRAAAEARDASRPMHAAV